MAKKSLTDEIPQHIAIIMDGNRRWARARGLADYKGHGAGADNLVRILKVASKMGVKTLTVYALSTENLQERAKREITAIFLLVEKMFKSELSKMTKNGVRVDVIGEIEELPKRIQDIFQKTKKVYIENESIKLNIALNYGGRKELISAIRKLIGEGIDLKNVREEDISRSLYTSGQSDPQLLIRTGGRVRLSNFLLWQTAYSELYFSKKLWPDFAEKDLKEAISWYGEQKRNFGK